MDLRRIVSAYLLGCVVVGCQGASNSGGPPGEGLGGASSGQAPDPSLATDIPCKGDAECADGAFCNGAETCYEGFCYKGIAPRCDDGIECTSDSCSHALNSCTFVAPDEDGDGHLDASCKGPDGVMLGDDCDDQDSSRFPGNVEVCDLSQAEHDEDCDPATFGHLDFDQDGYVSDVCCNQGPDGEYNCGTDCDDQSHRRYPDHPEICDDIDNDCDGKVDVNTKEVNWYPDDDGDNYGSPGSTPILSCAPVEGYALRATDCDDGTGAVHAAAVEVCDGVDNNCNDQTDENSVCACAPEGNARPCACSPTRSGIQTCAGGLWGTCDCSECITGTVDCLGDLLPRSCVSGQWQVLSSCKGNKPICLEGECVCADGTTNCGEPVDVIPPVVVSSYPSAAAAQVPTSSVISVQFSEAIDPLSVSGAFSLKDAQQKDVPVSIQVAGDTVVITPTGGLLPGMLFTYVLSTAVADLAGNTLEKSWSGSLTTPSAVKAVDLNPAVDKLYLTPRLGMSRDGQAMILAEKFIDNVGSAGWVQLDFDGASWSETSLSLSPANTFDALLIDDAGYAEAIEKGVSDQVARFSLSSSGWTSSSTSISSVDNTGIAVGVASNAQGDVVTLTRGASKIQVDQRDSSGTWTGPLSLGDLGGMQYRRVDVSDSRYGAAVYDAGAGQVGVLKSGANLSAWAPLPLVGSGTGADEITEADVCVNESGVSTVLMSQLTDGGGGVQNLQAVVQDFDASGAWIGSSSILSGAFHNRLETMPRVGVDADGNVHALYVIDAAYPVAMVRPAGGNFGSETIVGLVGASGLAQLELRVSEGGQALAVWTQKRGFLGYDLWFARYTVAGGWGSPGLLEDDEDSVTSFQVELDAAGGAIVLFYTDSWKYVQP